jgi:2-dehydro-3-deoxyphosphogluconate aldolase/(4S)-4-hydroxy-2-oxoglutarate aldolase
MNIEQSQAYFERGFRDRRVMVILRGADAETTAALSRRAWDAGLAMVEVPLQSVQSELALRAAVKEARNRGEIVGAGTITSVELAEQAADAGAAFTVAPGFDPAVLARSLELGMPHLPGVATPTEVQTAMNRGVRWLKAFPADALGLSWIAGMMGPFPDARFVATGGVTAQNAVSFLDAGASAVSLGSSFAGLSPAEVDAIR